MARPILHVNIIGGGYADHERFPEAGTVLADVDATSTVDAMAYFLGQHAYRYPERQAIEMSIEAERLRVQQVDSTWPSTHSEDPQARFVTESRSPVGGLLQWAFIAEVHG